MFSKSIARAFGRDLHLWWLVELAVNVAASSGRRAAGALLFLFSCSFLIFPLCITANPAQISITFGAHVTRVDAAGSRGLRLAERMWRRKMCTNDDAERSEELPGVLRESDSLGYQLITPR
jgi:hypothetical protein